MTINKLIIELFEELIKYEKNEINGRYKIIPLIKVVRYLKNKKEDIKSSQEINLEGVGNSTKRKIDEIIKTKKLSDLDEIKVKDKKILNLTKIDGIGPVTAKKLYDFYKIKSIQDLKDFSRTEKGKKILSDQLLLGIKYYNDIKKRFSRKEAENIDLILQKIFNDNYMMVGSYRRNKKTLGDIDILIKNINIKDFIDKLKNQKNLKIVDQISLGPRKFSGYLQYKNNNVRRLDILYIDEDKWPFSLLYFTGSKDFNIMMRNKAKSLGYLLNDSGLFDSKTLKKINNLKTEKDIFKKLNLKYIKPQNREI